MMNLILGPPLFREFLVVYSTKYKSANTSLDNVWRVLQVTMDKIKPKIFQKSVKAEEIMQSWTTQKGHPLVTVQRDYETGTITLKQVRNLINSNIVRGYEYLPSLQIKN